jgi:hypothetical protein
MSDSSNKILVLALVALLGCVGLCVCAGLFGLGSMVASAPEFDVSIEDAEREGNLAGAAGSTDSCIRTGYDRAVVCGYGFDCGAVVDTYLRACLRSVPSPDPSICVGAPAPSLMGDEAFDIRVCESRGWTINEAPCNAVVQALETYCAAL